MQSTLSEYDVKIVEMTTNCLEYYISFISKAMTGFERFDSNFENATKLHCILQKNSSWKEESVNEANFVVLLC